MGDAQRPDWWDTFLEHVDALPSRRVPDELVIEFNAGVLPEWRESGLLDVVVSGLFLQLRAEDPRTPLPGAELAFVGWETFHAELAEHGPVEVRARFNDLLWVRRREVARAEDAARLYLRAAVACASDTRLPNAGHYVQRALAISSQLRRLELNAEAIEAGLAMMRDSTSHINVRWTLARMFAEHGGEISREVAELLEGIAADELARTPSCDWRWTREVVRFAALARKALGEQDNAARLRQKAADLYIQEANALESAGASPFLIADCYSRGVRALRDAGCPEAAEVAHRRLVQAQTAIPAVLGRIELQGRDVTDEALESIEFVKGKPFLEQILGLSSLVHRGTVAKYRELAEASLKQFKVRSLIPFGSIDDKGRNLKSPRTPVEEVMLENVAMHRGFSVFARLQPAMHQIAVESAGSVNEWIEVLRDRPLCDEARIVALAKGLSAGLAGDWIVATSILVPQFEYLIRRLLGEVEETTSTLNHDGTQHEKLFSELLRKPKLTQILGEDWVYDLKCLLVEPGRNVRNRVAHGMVDDSAFNSVESVYLWFLVIELVMKIGVTRVQPATVVTNAEKPSAAFSPDAQVEEPCAHSPC